MPEQRDAASGGDFISLLELLHTLVQANGSDLHCKVGSPPRVRVDGKLVRLEARTLTAEDTMRFLKDAAPERALGEFERRGEVDFAHSVSGLGRFRVNAYKVRGSCGLAVRRVPVGAVPLEDLGLPHAVRNLAMEPRGLVLVTGPTGVGKTTTLASMVDLINRSKELHIVTVEDPIEVLHPDNRSMVSQREVRFDTEDFPQALRAALRQDPDVILVGEMRDEETVRAALTAAATGHLVLSTLHTSDAAETVSRIVDFFPLHEQQQARLSLANVLRGVVCQRLVPKASGQGRQVVVEVCINSGRVAEAIMEQQLSSTIHDLIREDTYYGMQTFDQHLMELVQQQCISAQEATHAATNPYDLVLEMRRTGLVA